MHGCSIPWLNLVFKAHILSSQNRLRPRTNASIFLRQMEATVYIFSRQLFAMVHSKLASLNLLLEKTVTLVVVRFVSFRFLSLFNPAKIVKLVSEHEVAAQHSFSLDCRAEGNPQPSYNWTPCHPQQSVCHKSVLHFQASDKSVYAFTCKVENYLGSDARNTFICKLARVKLLAYK